MSTICLSIGAQRREVPRAGAAERSGFADRDARMVARDSISGCLVLVVLLMALGTVAVAAASPAAARQYEVAEFAFFQKHVVLPDVMGLGLMVFGVLPRPAEDNARRLGILMAVVNACS